ncbi:TRAP transporter small permease subunit [Halomonas cupida]|uniref:TRAP transporter small permease subunit n=1 Tax=Halomonas TaxID=2745 RepID=UPI001A8FC6BF|nr:TRAP transporter small permease [Halomonas litopenaei]MBN8413811.1 TRAP transporter small permease [Halomonas litopenaei]MED5296545.1 TRAP transporter small permease [Pseudomonadota bacterium]
MPHLRHADAPASDRSQGLDARLARLSRGAALAAGYGALVLSGLITFEVLARKFFAFSLQGVDEIGGYVLAIGVAASFAFALTQRAHTRVDVLLTRLPQGMRALLNAVAQLLLCGFSLFMLWRGAATLGETIEFSSLASTPLQTPLWIPQSLWLIGLSIFALVTLRAAGKALSQLCRGRFSQLNADCDPPSADDELDQAKRHYVDAGSASSVAAAGQAQHKGHSPQIHDRGTPS